MTSTNINLRYRKRTQDSVWYNFLPIMEKYDIKVTRGWVKRLIKIICSEWRIKRESIGIIAAARASMYFDGHWSSVSFEDVVNLAKNGTDIIFIEKADIIEVLSEFADKYGIALVNTIGYLTDYGQDLIQAASKAGAHVAIITDYDIYGLHMASKIPAKIPRIAIDEETLQYFGLNKADKSLAISAEPGLRNLDFLSRFENVIDRRFLKHQKIEIDAVLAKVGGERLWEYVMHKLIQLFPNRNYNRAISMPAVETLYPEPLQRLLSKANAYVSNVVNAEEDAIRKELENVEGMIDVNEKKEEIHKRLQEKVDSDKELKTIVKKAEELIESTALDDVEVVEEEEDDEEDDNKE